MTRSRPRQRSSTLLATWAPSASRGSVWLTSRSNTESANPLANSRRAIAPPIRPRPISPTSMIASSFSITPGRLSAWRREHFIDLAGHISLLSILSIDNSVGGVSGLDRADRPRPAGFDTSHEVIIYNRTVSNLAAPLALETQVTQRTAASRIRARRPKQHLKSSCML